MTIAKILLNRAFVAAIACASFTGLSQAAESITLKPLHGVSFKAGDARGVGYFQSEHGGCKLILTFATDENGEPAHGFTATRHETVVGSGQATRYSIADQPYEFACQANAAAMTFKPLSRLAAAE